MASITLALGLRQKLVVSMTPSKTLAQALGEFCAKFELDTNDYSLFHKSKPVDLSLAFRLSGIVSNATLDVKQKASSSKAGSSDEAVKIQVAVQIDTTRHILAVPNTMSLWEILESIENEKKVVILKNGVKSKAKEAKSDSLYYAQPIINFMTTEIVNNTDIRKTTLRSLGITSGSALFRLRFKITDEILETFLEKDAQLAADEVKEAAALNQKIAEVKAVNQQKMEELQQQRAEEEKQKKNLEAEAEIKYQGELEESRIRRERQVEEENEAKRAAQEAKELEDLEEATKRSLVDSFKSKSHPNESSSMDIDKSESSTKSEQNSSLSSSSQSPHSNTPPQQPRKKFEVVVEPPGPPGLMDVLLHGGMIDEDHRTLHELLRKNEDKLAQMNQIPGEPCNRNPLVFAPSNTPFNPSSIQLPDDFFDVTAADISKLKESTRQSNTSQHDLKTKTMKEKERLERLAKFKKCLIRIRFPDRIELQGTFYPQENTSHVMDFVRSHLKDQSLDFFLYSTPPTVHLHQSQNLRDQGFIPAALIHVGLNPGTAATSPFLNEKALAMLKEKTFEPTKHVYTSSEIHVVTDQTSSSSMDIDSVPESTEKNEETKPKDSKSGDKKGVPKWFLAGKKH